MKMDQENTLECDGSMIRNVDDIFKSYKLSLESKDDLELSRQVTGFNIQKIIPSAPTDASRRSSIATSISSISDDLNDTRMYLDVDLKKETSSKTKLDDLSVDVGAIGNEALSTALPGIQSIAIKNSTDITFGNKTHYHGPVTIKQILVGAKPEPASVKRGGEVDNLSNSNTKESCLYHAGTQQSGVAKENEENPKRAALYRNWYLFGCLGLSTMTVLSMMLVFLLMTSLHLGRQNGQTLTFRPLLGDGDDTRKNVPIHSTIGSSLINSSSTLRLVSRSEWIAQPPNNELTPLELPSLMVIIAHTATEFCETQAACTFQVRFIQTFHIESRNWDDIGYNFLVGGDGSVYEGRGWEKQGAHTKGFNRRSICISFIGTFNKIKASQRQINAAKLLIADGIRKGYLDKKYHLYGHRQLIPTESPGEALYEEIKTWPNWSPEPIHV